jgi:hypothetical protein
MAGKSAQFGVRPGNEKCFDPAFPRLCGSKSVFFHVDPSLIFISSGRPFYLSRFPSAVTMHGDV